MAKINKIKLSGVTYDVEDLNATKTVELTQAQYDALVSGGTVDPNTYYIISDASGGDLSQYWTSAQTQSAITQATSGLAESSAVTEAIDAAVSGKQDTLISGTNIKTINNESILGEGNITIQGGGMTSGEVQSMIDESISGKVDTSAITTTITSASTDSEIPTAKAVYDAVESGGGGGITSGEVQTMIDESVSGKQDTLISGTNIKTINNVSILGSGNIDIQGGGGGVNVVQTTGTSTTDVMSQDAVTTQFVTTDTLQTISGRKVFTYSSSSSKAIEFKQTDDSSKVGFTIKNSASTNNEVASFEFRPNTFTVDGVQHPLLYFGHYRNTNVANAGVPQTVIGFRQYDQKKSAAYHYLMPLPEKAKTPFSLTTTFKDYYAPMGFKVNTGGTIVKTDETGLVDLSSYMGLPISADTNTITLGKVNIKIGTNNVTTSNLNRVQFAMGDGVEASGIYSFAFGDFSKATNYNTVSMGYMNNSNNQYEVSFGKHNNSVSGSSTFGDSGNTLFSVGNGTSTSARHNAFEIRQNGDIYCSDGTNDVKLQDTITATAANTTALGGLSLVKLAQAQYDALATKDSNTLYVIVN